MSPSNVELAVLNNVRWYEAMFAAHGLASETDGRVWRSLEAPPPFHSNLVVLSRLTTSADIEAYAAAIEAQPRATGWSLKDSYACLDLASQGFGALFQADWIWRDPAPEGARAVASRLSWARVATPEALAEWERSWAGDTRNETDLPRRRQFPDSLLDSPAHAFFAGRLDGKVVAGGIANRSPGVVGVSNVFAPRVLLDDTWRELVASISVAFRGTPIVGYERGDDLNAALNAGFAAIGKLRVWCRPA